MPASVAQTTGVRYLSLADAAVYTGVGQKTLRRYIAAGQLRAHRVAPGGKLIRIEISDLDAMMVPAASGVLG